MNTPPKHRLRWYQYSLRSLFVLTVLVAIAGSWFAVKRQQVERQRAAVRAIKELGGKIVWDYELDSQIMQIPNPKPPGVAWLRAWLGDDFFARVAGLSLCETKITDAELDDVELAYAMEFAHLRMLSLGLTRVSDAGLEHVASFSQLELLDLTSTDVTDAGLEHLRTMNKLHYLFLGNTKVTEEGIDRLQDALPMCTIRP